MSGDGVCVCVCVWGGGDEYLLPYSLDINSFSPARPDWHSVSEDSLTGYCFQQY